MSDSAGKLTLAQQIDKLCDRFESEWTAGRRPRIEDFLGQAKEPARSALIQALVLVEAELLRSAGTPPQMDVYAARFPDHTAIVREALAGNSVRSKRGSIAVDDAQPASKQPSQATQSLRSGDVDTSHSSGPGSNASTPTIPKQISRFEILEVLGEGGFGAVYKAHDPQLDRLVAIKVPRAGSFQTPADRERFLREARASATLSHTNICPVYEIGESDGLLYIVMALVEGKPLSQAIAAGKPLPIRHSVAAVRKLALALQEAHDRGIVHRDLKPANIMINRKGEPVVMDFGLARRAVDADVQLTQSGAIMGTPAYMSPEQARGEGKHIGPVADIYSLGVVLYELLCGRRPFNGTMTEVLVQVLHDAPVPPSQHRAEVGSQLDEICLRAIAKEPSGRFASMQDFAEALAGYLRSTDPRMLGTQPQAAVTVEPAAREHLATTAAEQAQLDTPVATAGSTSVARMLSGLQSELREYARKQQRPWWLPLVGAGFLGIFVLLGIMFFTRTSTATVLINIDVDLKDPQLRFVLDGKDVPADKLAVPMELSVGSHELLVWRGEKLERKFTFDVKGGAEPAIAIKEATPKPRQPAGVAASRGTPPPIAKAPFDAQQARAHQEAWAKYLRTTVETTNSVGMKIVLIPPGEFLMGSTAEQMAQGHKMAEAVNLNPTSWEFLLLNAKAEEPQHSVRLTKPTRMSATEVTVGQFRKFVEATNYRTDVEEYDKNKNSRWDQTTFPITELSPVCEVSWADAVRFCNWLSLQEGHEPCYTQVAAKQWVFQSSAEGYRLPTEAEWEFACRAGTTTQFSFGDNVAELGKYAWYVENSAGKTHAVAEKLPNSLGLYDMHGNVYEWCHDWFSLDYYADSPPADPLGPAARTESAMFDGKRYDIGYHVSRGGNWNETAAPCRSASHHVENIVQSKGWGFRVVRTVKGVIPDNEGGFQQLFNDHDLAGWKVLSGDASAWNVENGAVVGRSEKHTVLVTDKKFSNFTLKLEFQLPVVGANGGVYLYMPDGKSFEINLLEPTARTPGEVQQNQMAGALWLDQGNQHSQPAQQQAAPKPLNEWNELKVDLQGLDLTVTINGVRVQQVRLDQLPGLFDGAAKPTNVATPIGLQTRRQEIRYRNVRIREGSFSPIAKDSNLLAAEQVRKIGGTLELMLPENGRHIVVKATEPLPDQKFHLIMAVFGTDAKLTDQSFAELKGTQVPHINLDHTSITDAGLEPLKDVVGLTDLRFIQVPISDASIARIKAIPRLEVLELQNAAVSDAGIAQLAEMPKLNQLYLLKSGITDKACESLAKMKQLTQLWTSDTQISDRGLARLAELPRLVDLRLGNSTVTDVGMTEISKLTDLHRLELQGTNVSDAGLAALRPCKSLEHLDLARTLVTDAGLQELGGLKQLRVVFLIGTKVTAAGAAALQKALPNCKVEYDRNIKEPPPASDGDRRPAK